MRGHMEFVLLETDRLLLRRFREEDTKQLCPVLSDAEVMRYIEPPFSMEETSRFIAQAGLCDPPLVYALVWKAANEVIGHVIFHPYDGDGYEIGWIISKAYWNRGIASEVTEKLGRRAVEMNVKKLVMECDQRQAATIHIAERLGFVWQGTNENLIVFRKEITK